MTNVLLKSMEPLQIAKYSLRRGNDELLTISYHIQYDRPYKALVLNRSIHYSMDKILLGMPHSYPHNWATNLFDIIHDSDWNQIKKQMDGINDAIHLVPEYLYKLLYGHIQKDLNLVACTTLNFINVDVRSFEIAIVDCLFGYREHISKMSGYKANRHKPDFGVCSSYEVGVKARYQVDKGIKPISEMINSVRAIGLVDVGGPFNSRGEYNKRANVLSYVHQNSQGNTKFYGIPNVANTPYTLGKHINGMRALLLEALPDTNYYYIDTPFNTVAIDKFCGLVGRWIRKNPNKDLIPVRLNQTTQELTIEKEGYCSEISVDLIKTMTGMKFTPRHKDKVFIPFVLGDHQIKIEQGGYMYNHLNNIMKQIKLMGEADYAKIHKKSK